MVKKRVALPGRGKSGGTRTLIATNMGTRWYFVFGFEKNERDNIAADELAVLKRLATDLLKLTNPQISTALSAGTLLEISGVES
ncbi:MAG: type II toxin-antitoxin system RelE/ParE family toxin [Burkholderiales bacterium]|nr:type II toxin-antitoxin system RelE/ParE family toxin [Burkholderiales bacterium]